MGPPSPGAPTRTAPRAPSAPTQPPPAPPRPTRPPPPPGGPPPPRPPEPLQPAEHDIRRKRPPVLSFVLRVSTARRLARVLSLLALDFAGVALAIFTALLLKEAVHGHVNPTKAWHGSERFLAFAYLLTALLFARSGLYAARSLCPGLSRIVGSLFQVAFVALIFAVVSGEHFSSYYLFYGTLLFGLLYVSSMRAAYEWFTGLILRAA